MVRSLSGGDRSTELLYLFAFPNREQKRYNFQVTTLRYEIVPARPEDAEAIGNLRAESWDEQYGSLPGLDADWIEKQVARITSDASREQRTDAIAESSRPGARNFWRVARLAPDQTIVGFVDARRLDEGRQELHSIHVAAGYRSHGIGQALMNTAHIWFDPHAPVFLDVARDNHRALDFYMRSSNDYHPTGYIYTYEQLGMMRMQREARV